MPPRYGETVTQMLWLSTIPGTRHPADQVPVLPSGSGTPAGPVHTAHLVTTQCFALTAGLRVFLWPQPALLAGGSQLCWELGKFPRPNHFPTPPKTPSLGFCLLEQVSLQHWKQQFHSVLSIKLFEQLILLNFWLRLGEGRVLMQVGGVCRYRGPIQWWGSGEVREQPEDWHTDLGTVFCHVIFARP